MPLNRATLADMRSRKIRLATVDNVTTTSRRLAVGLRAAAGLELKINGHLSVQGDVGYEHFFFVDQHFEDNVFVPTLGVIGRL